MTTFKPYLIQCVTNLHAGSGDTTYGVIDKQVQRDPVTNNPTIHASSLKGALREHFEQNSKEIVSGEIISQIFGSNSRNNGDSNSGYYKFLSADLLALPVRCTHKQFVHVFSENIAKSINQKLQTLTGRLLFREGLNYANTFYTNDMVAEVFTEDVSLSVKPHIYPLEGSQFSLPFFRNQFAAANDDFVKSAVTKLPVIARNNIEDGTSQNLWYEEVVPHQSLFITFIGTSHIIPGFETVLLNDIIQVGANATIGYGLCKFFAL